jgi:hypothetical protein
MVACDKQYWLLKILVKNAETISPMNLKIFLDIYTDDPEVLHAMLLHPFIDVEYLFTLACKRGHFFVAEDALKSGRLDLALAIGPALCETVQTKHSGVTAWLLAVIQNEFSKKITHDAIRKVMTSCGDSSHFGLFLDWNIVRACILSYKLLKKTEAFYSTYHSQSEKRVELRNDILEIINSPHFDGSLGFKSSMLSQAILKYDCELANAYWSHDSMKAYVFIDIFHDWICGRIDAVNVNSCPMWSPLVFSHPDLSSLPIWKLGVADEDVIQSLFLDRILSLPGIFGHFSEQINKVHQRKLTHDIVHQEFRAKLQDGSFGDLHRLARLLKHFIEIQVMGGLFIQSGLPIEICRKILMTLLVDEVRKIRLEDERALLGHS